MLVIAAFSFLTWEMLAVSAARRVVSSRLAPQAACESDHEEWLSEQLWTNAMWLKEGLGSASSYEQDDERMEVVRSTPFASCSPARRDLPLEKIATDSLETAIPLCAIGKLAKGGDFFASKDGSVLTKLVSVPEAKVLQEWGRQAAAEEFENEYQGGCDAFSTTLLVESTLSFETDTSNYIVMPNLTYTLEHASPDNWKVVAVYDAKPLPNLGKGLVRLFKDLIAGWGFDRARLGDWTGWGDVKTLMERDMAFLADRVVDFSLFVHVLRGKGEVPDMFEPSKGCIVDPLGTLVVCFRVLDYLTPFGFVRRIESLSKIDKFHDYAGKFMGAFNCLNDVDTPHCAKYKDLGRITEAMAVSKNMAKAAFIGTTAFREAYTCTHETPKLKYETYEGSHKWFAEKWYDSVDAPVDAPEGLRVAKTVSWVPDGSKSSDWLQTIASPEVAQSVGPEAYKMMEEEYSMSEARGRNSDQPAYRMPTQSFHSCIDTVKKFATEGYIGMKTKSDMLNVLWEDDSKHVIVVRGLPKTKLPIISLLVNLSRFNPLAYEHKGTVEVGRLDECFLKTVYMRCDPPEQGGFHFNYQQHFGALEVMVMSAKEHSDDMMVYLEALERGQEIVREDHVSTNKHFDP